MYKCMPPSRHIGFNRILQRVCAFLFLLAMVKEMPAQHRRGLPDSVVLKDTIQSSENVAQAADSSGANAAEDKKTDDDERLISRIVPDSVVYTAKRDKDFEYANDPAYWP